MSSLQEELQPRKDLFIAGLAYSTSQTGFYFGPNEALSREQIKQVQNASNFQDLCWAIQIYNFVKEFGYRPQPKTNEAELLQLTAIDLARTVQSRYIVSGGSNFNRFTFTLWACRIAPPHVIEEQGVDVQKSILWLIAGGFWNQGQWISLPEEWLSETKYQNLGSNRFLFEGKSSHIHVIFGSPDTFEFQLNLTFQEENQTEHQLTAYLLARARPKFILNNALNNLYRQTSFVYADMSLELSVERTTEANGLGFVQRTELLAPPHDFAGQTMFVARLPLRRDFVPILSLFVQFSTYQYLLTAPCPEAFYQGMYLDRLEGTRYAYDVSTKMKSAELSVVKTIVLQGQTFPQSIQVLIEHNLGITGDAGQACALILNAVMQADFQATMEVRDTANNVGFGLLRVNNVLNVDKWGIVSLGDKSWGAVLVSQPVVHHRWLAIVLVYVLPSLVVIALILVLFLAPK